MRRTYLSIGALIMVAHPAWAQEDAEDARWQRRAVQLQNAAAAGGDVAAQLAQLAPEVAWQLAHDARLPLLLGLWGESYNDDEHARAPIVALGIEDAILALGGAQPQRDRVVHAGLTHTYGYLFSTLPTPFGFKRARWLDGTIEAGLGLPRGTLGPEPQAGSLLANVTWVAGGVAFRDASASMQRLHALADAVDPVLLSFDFAALAPACVEECVDAVCLHTDLVPLPRAHDGAHWLIYSVHTNSEANLISAFPVAPPMVNGVLSQPMGAHVPITTRYNAYVAGLSDVRRPVDGRRGLCPPPRR